MNLNAYFFKKKKKRKKEKKVSKKLFYLVKYLFKFSQTKIA